MTLLVHPHRDGVVIAVRVRPGAKRSAVIGEHGGALKIAIAAPPVDGKANAELVEFLAEALGIRRSQIEIIGGETSREKRVLLRGVDDAQARQLIQT